MANILLSSDEPSKLITLVEKLFPGVHLGPIQDIFNDFDITGNVTIKDVAENLTLNLTITDPIAKK
jgi:hypothetical protein